MKRTYCRAAVNLVALTFFLVFAFGCSVTNVSNYLNTPTSNIETIESTHPIPTPGATIGQQEVQLQGILVLSCQNGIYQYDFKSKTFTTLDSDNTRLYFDVGWNRNGIYYLRTTDLKEQNVPAGGQFGPNDIFGVKPNGTNVTQLTNDDYHDFNLAISPYSDYLVYVSDRIEPDHSPNRYKLVMIDIDDQTEKILAEGVNQFLPVWSPNGDKIAILEIPGISDEKAELLLYDVHQDKLIQLYLKEHVLPSRIAWSHDQKYIAVGVKDTTQFNIDFVDVSTGAVEKIISVNDEPRNLIGSPDGDKLLFETRIISNDGNMLSQLKMLDVLQRTTILLHEEDGKLSSYSAEWSPGSEYIAFSVGADNLYPKVIVQDIATLKEIYFEIPCPRVGNSVWLP